ncbi:TPA_asm: LPXTG cell wall anchor domain-containing protein [Listeria monocytogenes]|uniref:LPXTG cell wall anchor domain-containing protein n=4 Tax=Listeria monocytogenes TaxID=1639 RepID=A0AAN5IPU6_LISMN|nr:MucBP domain-containing protein [Listeria monocytogenes]MCZ93279.1 LPXTG cell wall anchor domain-containing protein [Listeria monocytogenes serotype 3c]MDA81526.1 LPXTG cell wall anchor domain-containing protein [Listeria monocytogenes serotype 1/2b]EAC8150388.1 LPXTG cell wall anchor domain-containing protein [Listeria monocytogenes]EAD5895245.1 LPXTG cell wall anchor domain-containing protein [Listeria monocytogenes]EAE3097864.1 LPXTG cell wall anchor domain-containing protein [Listeria m
MKTSKIIIASLVSLTLVSNPILTFAATNDVIDNTTEITTDKETSPTQPTIKNTLKAGQTQSFNDWFPDDNFASEVAAAFEMQATDTISEEQLATLTSLDCHNSSIADMTGIEKLTGLTKLICTYNNITTLDLSQNTNLTYLACDSNKLTNLDVTPLTKLTYLNCDTNKLTKIDVSQNPLLTYLNCARNTLTEIDVSHNTQLTELDCHLNKKITKLDVTPQTQLTTLDCSFNKITALDVSQNKLLNRLNCDTNNITKLDLNQNIQLTFLDCSSNKLTEIDVTPLTQLTYFDCSVNPLTELDVSTLSKLTTLHCIQTDLLEIDLTHNTQLIYFQAEGCRKIKELDVTHNTQLYLLDCQAAGITELDLSQNPKLVYLYLNNTELTKLDVSHNTKLKSLSCVNAHIQDFSSVGKIPVLNNNLDAEGQTITMPKETLTNNSLTIAVSPDLLDQFGNPMNIEPGDGGVYDQATNTITWENLSTDNPAVTYTFTSENGAIVGTVTTPFEAPQPIKGEDVTVHYLDDKGEKLAADEVLSGNLDDPYTSSAKDIPDYTLTTTPDNATGTFTTTSQSVTYVYTKNIVAAEPVTVNYVDDTGKTLAPSETLNGNVGDTYNATAKQINGYTLTTTPDNATGTFTTTSQSVTYVYTKNIVAAEPITVNYVDDTGKTLAPSETLNGNVGDTYNATAKQIDGYTLSAEPTNATGQFTSSAQTVNYIYTKNPAPEKGVVEIHYVDENNKQLSSATKISGTVGDNYTTEPKNIDSYTLTTTPDNATGTFNTSSQTVTYVYTKNIVAAEPVTVNYVDANGKTLAPSETLNGTIGDTYNATAKQIDGYTLSAEPTNATGQFTNSAQTVNYIYTKNTNIDQPLPDKKTTKPSNLKTTEVKKASDTLPKTGDSAPWKSALLGVFLSSTALVIWKKKK